MANSKTMTTDCPCCEELRKEIQDLKETVATLTEVQKQTIAALNEVKKTSTDYFQRFMEPHRKADDAAAAANGPDDEAEMIETPVSTAIAPPLFPTKRSFSARFDSVDEEREEEEEEEVEPHHKRSRKVTATERSVLDELKLVLSLSEFDALKTENARTGVEALYKEYSSRTTDAGRWMATREFVAKDCCLCGARRHHAFACDKFRTVEKRKSQMRRQHVFCMECSNRHSGKCRGATNCWMCKNAQAEGRFVLKGIQHPRIWCPLQEQFFKDKEVADKLFRAKRKLSEIVSN